MKKISSLVVILSILILTLTSCGNSNYRLEEGSKLTKEDINILKKSYNSLSKEQKTDLILMDDKMSEGEYIKFKDNLKRLYVEEMASAYGSVETAGKMFENSYDLKLREKQGKLTDEEKIENESIEKKAKESNNEVKKYMEAKDKIQDNLDNNLKNQYNELVVESKVIDSDSLKKKITIDVNVVTFKSVTVGQMTTIRNKVAQEVIKIIECDTVEIKLKLNSEDKGIYNFTQDKGWDKNIEP